MRIVTLPGVFSPISDTWLLAGALREQIVTSRTSVLDVCTGSGALAVCAAMRGARNVTAVDVSRRAVATAVINGRLNRVRVRGVRSDLFEKLGDQAFDVIVSNPPYVPAETDELPEHGPERAWDAGRDGRALLDRLLATAPAHLRPGGRLLVVHSEIIGIGETMERMRAGGLAPDIAARQRGPLGPLMLARVRHLEAQGLIAPGLREEEVVVIRGTAPLRHLRVRVPSRPAPAPPPPPGVRSVGSSR